MIDGILYGTTPKLRLFALDAATGKELWKFDPNPGKPAPQRFRHRGVVVTGDRVLYTYRNRLYAIDRTHGTPIKSFGDSGWVDLRAGLDRPIEGLSVSASTPGVVFEDLYIIGSTVPEALPSAPGDIRAYDVKTGALRWSFHTIPHPGEFGYESWPADAWKIAIEDMPYLPLHHQVIVWAMSDKVTMPIFAQHILSELTGVSDASEALRRAAAPHHQMSCVTLGARGALLLVNGEILHEPAMPVTAVDTTGAGDLFRAGFIFAWLSGAPPREMLRMANAAAALSCTRPGAMASIPALADVRALAAR